MYFSIAQSYKITYFSLESLSALIGARLTSCAMANICIILWFPIKTKLYVYTQHTYIYICI